jgi:hypothetical protein
VAHVLINLHGIHRNCFEFDSQQCNARTCAFKVSDPWGLGRERKYYDDDMDKQMRAIQEKKKENEWFKKTSECCSTKKKIYLIIQLMVKCNKIIQDISVPGVALYYMVEID